MSSVVEASEAMVKNALKEMQQQQQEPGFKGGRGLKKQPERSSELGWSDRDAEKIIIGVLFSGGAVKFFKECAGRGLKAADFDEREHEKIWEYV